MLRTISAFYLTVLLVCSLSFVACSADKQDSEGQSQVAPDNSPTDSLTITLTGADSVSVFDLLQQSHTVDYQSSAMGVFVKAIDSIYSGDNYFWVYSVNDTMAKTAADKYMTADGDTIIWHFRRVGE
jgi:hypothetical protein